MVIPRLQQRSLTWPRPALAYDFWFGQVNSRSLSLFRVGIALVLLRDALLHIPIAAAFYSDSGLTSRAAVRALLTDHPLRFSLLDGIGQPWLATLFFLGWAGVSLCLFVGYKTRLAAALNFICVLSIYWRNPFITSGADDILRVVSFWMLFIPLNHHYALDTWHKTQPEQTTDAFPVRLLQVQLALIYLGAGLSKLLGIQWTDGTALFYVLQLDSLLRPLGHWLRSVAPLGSLQGLTYSVLLLEISFPILIFAPVKQPALRHLAADRLHPPDPGRAGGSRDRRRRQRVPDLLQDPAAADEGWFRRGGDLHLPHRLERVHHRLDPHQPLHPHPARADDAVLD